MSKCLETYVIEGPTGPRGPTGPPGPEGPSDGCPSGIIVMWSGDPNNLPVDFILCDGSSYIDSGGMLRTTPDLRGRFIVSYDATAPSVPINATNMEINYGAVNNTGGQNFVALTVDQLAEHTHVASVSMNGLHDHTGVTDMNGEHTHTGTTSVNGLHTHTIPNSGQHSHLFVIPVVAGLGSDRGVATADAILQDQQYQTFFDGSHTHPVNQNGDHSHSVTIPLSGQHQHTFTTGQAGEHTHTVTNAETGQNEPHENRPSYYVLAFIMKKY